MPHLTSEQRLPAIGMLEAGRNQTEVTTEMGCRQSKLSKLVVMCTETGVIREHPRSGRTPVTTPTQDLYIVVMHPRDCFLLPPG